MTTQRDRSVTVEAVIAVFLAAAAAGAALLVTGVTAYFEAFPSHLPYHLIGRALGKDPAAKNMDYVMCVYASAHWFNAAVVQGIAGVLIGALARVLRASARGGLAAAALYCVVLLVHFGPRDPAAWTGAVLYLFCFTGAANFPRLTSRTTYAAQ